MSDQFRTDTSTVRPPCETRFDWILVKGQGPAMQENRALLNWFPSPASKDLAPAAAFHLRSGEQGELALAGHITNIRNLKSLCHAPNVDCRNICGCVPDAEVRQQ